MQLDMTVTVFESDEITVVELITDVHCRARNILLLHAKNCLKAVFYKKYIYYIHPLAFANSIAVGTAPALISATRGAPSVVTKQASWVADTVAGIDEELIP